MYQSEMKRFEFEFEKCLLFFPAGDPRLPPRAPPSADSSL